MELEKVENVLPSPNLSIDILSLINTNYESEESLDGFEQIELKESVNREGKGDEEQELNRFIKRSPQAHYKYRFPLAKTQDDFLSNSDNNIKNNTISSEEKNVGNHLPCNHHNNSFYVYLNSLSSDKDLHKYFRPCHTCKKTYCTCLDLLASCNISVLSLDSSERLQKKENKNLLDKPTLSTMNLMKMNKAVETDVNITEFDGCRYECLSFRSSKLLSDKESSECPDLEGCRLSSCRNSRTNFSASHNERKRNFCCQTWIYEHLTNGHLDSGIGRKFSFDLLREPYLEVASNQLLENVARNARNLARDLELITKTYKSESN